MKKKYFFLIFFILIFIVKTAYSFHQNSFSQDVARDLVLVGRQIEAKEFLISYGPKASVANFYLLPAYYQIHLILSLLSGNNPFTMRFFVIVLESLTPIILYYILRRLDFKKKISLGISFLYLISPMVMIFSTKAWNPNTLPFLTSLSFYCLLSYFKKEKGQYLIGLILLPILAFHFHLQAMVLLPFVFVLLAYLFFKKPKARSYIYWGILLSFLSLVPYLIGEMNNNWQNCRQIINYFLHEHSHYYARVSKFNYLFTFLPSFFERLLIHRELPLNFLGRGIFFLGMSYFFYLSIKEERLNFLAFAYFLSIILMLRVYKGDKVDYYMSSLYILPFILLAYIARLKKEVFLIFAFLISFLAGQYYARLERDTSYWELKEVVLSVESLESKEFGLLIHDYNQINSYLYFLEKYTDCQLNKDASFLLEICPKEYPCSTGRLICEKTRSQTYGNLYREANNFIWQSGFRTNSGFNYQFGKIENIEPNIGYELYNYDFSYGSDLLFDLSFN